MVSHSNSLLFVLNLQYCSECVSNTLSFSITVGMNFWSFSPNRIKWNINGTKLIELDDFKANAALFKYPSLPSYYWSGYRNPLYATVRRCKDYALCCPQLQSSVCMMWKAVLWGENAVHCVQWWLMNVIHCHIQTSAPKSLPFFYPCYLQPLHSHILGCYMFCKADEIISFWIWMKLDVEKWVGCSDLRQ